MEVESWCTVEDMPASSWARAQRKHNSKAFDSQVLANDKQEPQTDRSSGWINATNEPPHRERRHYVKSGKRGLPPLDSDTGCVRLPPPGIADSTGFHWIPLKDDEVN